MLNDMRMTPFTRSVLRMLQRIPVGYVVTYKTVAQLVGHPMAVRAVANAIGKNTDPKRVPCHRVICSDGRLGGYRWGVAAKQRRLTEEGVGIQNGRVVSAHILDARAIQQWSM